MKVAIVNNFPPYSGAGRATYEMWKELNKRDDIKADLICTHAMTNEEFGWDINKNVKFLHRFAYKGHEALSRLFIYLVDRFLIPTGYDVFHISNQMLSFLVGFRKPCVVTLFDLLQFKYHDKLGNKYLSIIYSWLIRRGIYRLRKADAVICNSELTKTEAIRLLKLDPKKLFVIYSGVNEKSFKPFNKSKARKIIGLPMNGKLILHVGNEIERKNVSRIIEVINECKKKNSNIILIRLGNKSKEIGEKIDKLKMKTKVIYKESFREEETALYYNAADMLLFPSLDEGFGLPIIESMACGCPVITSNYGAMSEVAGKAGYLVNPLDVNEMIKAVKDLTENIKLRNFYIKEGRNRVKMFTWKKQSDDVVSVYKRVLNKI